ncbi:hypothetical protein ABZX62_20265 [Streptomyces flavidovirens]|uniref:hypothetical protein n=1 Tax=Streptomyces flavidovirens TaxID=67298 RepID=UPI0033BF2E36
MPVYELRGDDHEVIETVTTVPESREDKRLAASDKWKTVEDQEATVGPLPKRQAKAAPTLLAKEG